ncbi:hypothetical protein F889_01532 [Acinetobacter colistiniresistens]|uniref:Phage tail protein n=1 Tax=Acinetobacter colistiniresistens TaxID=280145 RepID=N9R6W6_9GAMM|nr:Mov34/MPN/PAD-1 family protein [Acinetobacter colistiniresistens]ENX34892.1 hypothetical protein F889_01532 [Acinetobacter colistiniresistens]
MKLTLKLKKAIQSHAMESYPRESCGVIVNREYLPCRNIAESNDQFEIHPVDIAAAEEKGEIEAIVHSHPNSTATASELDLKQIEIHGKPWVICSYPDIDFQVYKPNGYSAPLVGRNYFHGWQDCYSLICDFYKRELGIALMDFERVDAWWEDPGHASLYLENYQNTGFYEVDVPQYGDMIICRVGRTEHPNHAVIWLGDKGKLQSEETEPCFGSSLILHHPYGRKSVREIYGKQWLDRTEKILRHKRVK